MDRDHAAGEGNVNAETLPSTQTNKLSGISKFKQAATTVKLTSSAATAIDLSMGKCKLCHTFCREVSSTGGTCVIKNPRRGTIKSFKQVSEDDTAF
jgi:hypothetical protein